MHAGYKSHWRDLRLLARVLPIAFSDCSVVNELDVCDRDLVAPTVTRVNEAGDGEEFIGHGQAAAQVDDDRILVVFNAQSNQTDDSGFPLASAVKLALLDTEGQSKTVCNSADKEATINALGSHAHAASVARAPLDIGGRQAAALIQWKDADTDRVQLRFVDSVACPMATEFHMTEGGDYAAALAWSEARGSVLLVLATNSELRAAWITGAEPAPTHTIARAEGRFSALPSVVVGSDGRAFVTWAELNRGPRAVLLSLDGVALTDPIDLGFPKGRVESSGLIVSATASTNHFAVTAEAQAQQDSERSVYVREFSADGLPLAAAHRLAKESFSQASPATVYLAPDALLVTWLTRTSASARVIGPDGASRFNALSCDEASFALLAQTGTPMGSMSALVVKEKVWVFAGARLPSDPRGNGVGLWQLPIRILYPAELN
jgi:hypothetical protein